MAFILLNRVQAGSAKTRISVNLDLIQYAGAGDVPHETVLKMADGSVLIVEGSLDEFTNWANQNESDMIDAIESIDQSISNFSVMVRNNIF